MRQIAQHFDRRREEFKRYSSGALTDADLDAMYFRLSPDGRAGIISGRIPLTEAADVHVFEHVVLTTEGGSRSSGTRTSSWSGERRSAGTSSIPAMTLRFTGTSKVTAARPGSE
jgi:hypothetical protein